MTHEITGTRKRLRSLNREEDCCNFMPISKRNNLHSSNSSLYIGFPHIHTEHALVKQAVDYTEILENLTVGLQWATHTLNWRNQG